MQVSIETLSTLERRMTVGVPAEKVESMVLSRLEQASKTISLKGFRKGKIPLKVVKNRFGKGVRQEVVGEVMSQSYYEALNQENVKPAGQPRIEAKSLEEGKDLEFVAHFEVYPDITLGNFSSIKIEKKVAKISESDIETMIETLRMQRQTFFEVAKPAQNLDQLDIDFVGIMDGVNFPGGDAKAAKIILGSKTMIPGFEEGIVGAKAGDELTVSPTFPKDYHAKELAGKTVAFAIKVNKVSESKLPTLDDAFAKRLNIKEGTVDSLRQEIRSNMGRELASRMKNKAKQAVMDAVFKAAKVNLPKALVDAEIQQMQQHLLQQLGGKGDIQALTEQSGGIFEEQATRRVTLGLLIGEYIKKQEMKPDADKVKAHIDEMALSYEKPEDVVQWYYGDKDRLAEVQALILEEQVVDNILSQAKVTEKPVKFADVMKQNDQNHGLSHDHDHSNCQDHDHQH